MGIRPILYDNLEVEKSFIYKSRAVTAFDLNFYKSEEMIEAHIKGDTF